MRKLFRNQVIKDHVIPTLIVVSFVSIILVIALTYAN